MMHKNVFSGIQPSGSLHVGNFIAAIKRWVEIQNSNTYNELIFCIVDLHTITIYQDPKKLRSKTFEFVKLYLACGIDEHKSKIFVQSDNYYHPYLAWILDCYIPIGWMNRMTQYKEKSLKQKKDSTVGLFNYPALMAADILLYDTHIVPVGEDQVQHVELTRDVAKRFNSIYGNIFVIPEAYVDKKASRIMSLQNPRVKMSKSDISGQGSIFLLDSPDVIKKKVSRAVTDSSSDIVYDPQRKPAISNLLVLFSSFSGKSIEKLEDFYRGKSYSSFKSDLAEVIIDNLAPIQEKYSQYEKEEQYLIEILKKNALLLTEKAAAKVKKVVDAIGLGVA